MELLDGKKVASDLYEKLAIKVSALQQKNIHPRFALVLVGENPASLSYTKQKKKACEQIGIVIDFIHLDEKEVTTESLLKKVQDLGNDKKIHGIIVQLPLPKHVDSSKIIESIPAEKDVDGFAAKNIGEMFLNKDYQGLAPCTPLGVMKLLEFYDISVVGKEVVVVGASNVVGKPLAIMMTNKGATVTVCNSKTKDLKKHTLMADILVVAVGKAKLITADMVKDGAVVVDVGINRTEDGKLIGDVDFENVAPKSSYITPVPGGCGPMTVASLMDNIIKAAEKSANK